MLTTLTCRLRRFLVRGAHESGQALLFVLLAVTLLASIPIAIATTTVDQLPQTARNLNYDASYEAAQAGLNDYIQHLDANESYGIFCKGCSAGTDSNAAFTSWVQTSTSPAEWYSYSANNTSGTQLTLKVSGKAGNGSGTVVRTFNYAITPNSTLDDVYWSNYETRDPVLGAITPGAPADSIYCATHYDEPSKDSYSNWAALGLPQYGPPTGNACEVSFASGDVLNGPIFSNDTFRVCGTSPGPPTFEGNVQSGNIYNTAAATTPAQLTAAGPVWVGSTGCASATPSFSVTPQKVGNQTPRNAEDDLTPARDYGCFITGGTDPSSLSPVNLTMTLATATDSHGNATTKVTWSGTGAKVDNAGTNSNSCASGFLSSGLTAGLIFVNGDVTVSGTMTGALDIVTCATDSDVANSDGEAQCDDPGGQQSNISIPANLNYPTANKTMVSGQPTVDTKDALGLIAQNFVVVTATVASLEVDAAILALQDSFYVSNWYNTSSPYSADGTLNVFGSIAQNFRGPVATSNGSGYLKNYNYDSSLETLFPPFFLPPSGANWAPTSYTELAPGVASSTCPSC
jgi:hypothetical protein